MTFAALPAPAVDASRLPVRIACVGTAFAAAATAGALVGGRSAADPATVEASLALLLRFMAICKAATALAAVVLLVWRLGRPLRGTVLVAYASASCLMGAAPGLIWGLGVVGPGALLFHAGLILFLVTTLRDELGVATFVPPRRHRG